MPELSSFLFGVTADVLNTVTAVAAPVVSVIFIRYLNRRFKLNIKEQQEKQIAQLAETTVMAASQKFQDLARGAHRNQQKKDDAVSNLLRQARQIGVKMTAEFASEKIEAAVNRLKRERGALQGA